MRQLVSLSRKSPLSCHAGETGSDRWIEFTYKPRWGVSSRRGNFTRAHPVEARLPVLFCFSASCQYLVASKPPSPITRFRLRCPINSHFHTVIIGARLESTKYKFCSFMIMALYDCYPWAPHPSHAEPEYRAPLPRSQPDAC